MASMNKVILIGNAGKDPDVKFTPSGLQIAKLSIATSENFKKGEEWESKTDWHNIVAFGKTAEIVEKNILKGDMVSIEGKLSYGSYEREDGSKVNTTDIIANVVKRLTTRDIQQPQETSQTQNADPTSGLPF